MGSKNSVVPGQQMNFPYRSDSREIWVDTSQQRSQEYQIAVSIKIGQRINPIKVSVEAQAAIDERFQIICDLFKEIATISGHKGRFSIKPDTNSHMFQVVDRGNFMSMYAIPTTLVDWKLLIETLGNRILAA